MKQSNKELLKKIERLEADNRALSDVLLKILKRLEWLSTFSPNESYKLCVEAHAVLSKNKP